MHDSAYTVAFVALGANLGDPIATLQQAINALVCLPKTNLLKVSSFYRTAPIGPQLDQPDFINAVAMIQTQLSAIELLRQLFAIEDAHGRTRERHQGPRTLDLDLLLYGECVQTNEQLCLPHPHMHERAFVLIPLLEIAPDTVIPGRGNNGNKGRADVWLSHCADQKVERLERLEIFE